MTHSRVSPPRTRRRWLVMALAAVLVAGLTAGLLAWAPWVSPPVLRPAGLAAGPATANSVAFRWSPPATGPLPDRYLIVNAGAVIASVPGTVTSYRQKNLDPATAYLYRVMAERGGKRSPQSAALIVRTLAPPLAQARLQGSWNIQVRNRPPAPNSRNGVLDWQFVPVCPAGACDVILRSPNEGQFSVTMKLTRTGAVYRGQAVTNSDPCGSGASAVPDPLTIRIRIRVTAATADGHVWAAAGIAGTMEGSYRYVSTPAFSCAAYTFTASLSGATV